jgi:hypothetical protein
LRRIIAANTAQKALITTGYAQKESSTHFYASHACHHGAPSGLLSTIGKKHSATTAHSADASQTLLQLKVVCIHGIAMGVINITTKTLVLPIASAVPARLAPAMEASSV